jgi:hypothetical protein
MAKEYPVGAKMYLPVYVVAMESDVVIKPDGNEVRTDARFAYTYAYGEARREGYVRYGQPEGLLTAEGVADKLDLVARATLEEYTEKAEKRIRSLEGQLADASDNLSEAQAQVKELTEADCMRVQEFKPIIEDLYNQRQNNPAYKDVLVCIIGYMQSLDRCKAAWAHLAKDAIDNNNTRIRALTLALRLSGHNIVGFNTDGIWYQGDIYHDERNGEGAGIGQWHNDHTNCIFRAKSDGAYEFIERGVYHPVVRGVTKLDMIKDRDSWVWGDIYDETADAMRFEFEEGYGVRLIEKGKK